MTRNAFNDIIHINNRKLFGVAFRILKNHQESEDVVQEVFMKMWMMKEKLDAYNDAGALAVTMTRNSCIDRLRKWKHIDSEEYGAGVQDMDTASSPHEQLVRNETVAIMHDIIENLPAAYREVIRLREIDGLSYEEIAVQNNTNINSLRVTVSRARQMIKEQYLKYSYERGKSETIA